jgi:hypothetical protein
MTKRKRKTRRGMIGNEDVYKIRHQSKVHKRKRKRMKMRMKMRMKLRVRMTKLKIDTYSRMNAN